ncbi:class 1 fructose-bisphosphatase [Halosolutus gelatinilyticus]|uniref:class 1 fructose-bisphosphatase n=1 Tax=Halosolutus gelatinilyticus TaxID=2931975 RepID=UPI001FF1DA4B|nr:class 1 fructose-bisphosphatase [Halosolutus gelatinilyticus]
MTDLDPIVDAVATVAADVPERLPELRAERSNADRNPSGDAQSAADRWFEDRFREALAPLDVVGEYASEERAAVLDCGEGYGVAIDPLDGSSNLASNAPIGTVLGIYDAPLPARGTDLVGSAIIVFGPWTTMFVAEGGAVTRYRLDDGAAVDPRPVSIPNLGANGSEAGICGYSGRRSDLPVDVRGCLDRFLDERTLRYTGAAVADVQNLLVDGGVLCYPRTDACPDGVLRLQYEANPIAHLVEAAGGRASDGRGRLLDRSPDGVHERVPVFVGSNPDIERVESAIGSTRDA